jgi:hypothetical protein
VIFRLSQKMNAKIRAGALASLATDDNPFADWSAQLFLAGRVQYILLSNTKALYSVVMYGKGITDDSVFIDRALTSIHEFMEADGLGFIYHRFIVPATGVVRFAKALDRSVTGSMNELTKFAIDDLAGGEMSPFEVGMSLNKVLLSAIATDGSGYGYPRDAFKAMASPQS